MRPIIGLSAYREAATWGVWTDVTADLLPADYARSIEHAGGAPVVLPVATAGAREVVARLDGLVICGGADVSPTRYAAEPHPSTSAWRDDRDTWEWALLDAADRRGIPVLGVCRGMQVMAAWSGGVLDQHTPDVVGHEAHSPGGDLYGTVEVRTEPGSCVRELVGERVTVGCHHHQSVREHPRHVPAAYAEDGTLEAMERPDRTFWLGVQWHPETREDAGLFRGLVDAAHGGQRSR